MIHNKRKKKVQLTLASLPLSARAGAAAISTDQPRPSIRLAGRLCSGLGAHPAGGTAASRHGVPHPAALSGCWCPHAAVNRRHQPQPGGGPRAQPALCQRGRQHHQWRQCCQVDGYKRGMYTSSNHISSRLACMAALCAHFRQWIHKEFFISGGNINLRCGRSFRLRDTVILAFNSIFSALTLWLW